MAKKGTLGRKRNPEKVAETAAKNALIQKITRQFPFKRQEAIRILHSQPDNETDYSQASIEDILRAMSALGYKEWDVDEAKWLKS